MAERVPENEQDNSKFSVADAIASSSTTENEHLRLQFDFLAPTASQSSFSSTLASSNSQGTLNIVEPKTLLAAVGYPLLKDEELLEIPVVSFNVLAAVLANISDTDT
jgi:hypothetical protein